MNVISVFNFKTARNVAVGSSFADTISLVVFIFFHPDLFLKLCNHPLLAVNGLVSFVLGNSLLMFSYRLCAFWCNTLPSIGMSSTYKFNAFSILAKYLIHSGHNLYSLRYNSKNSMNFFFHLHNSQIEGSFLLWILAFSAYNFFLTENCHLSH